jgi:transcriptional regulator with XRE-family HTH domain
MPPRLASETRTPLREALVRKGLSQAGLARVLHCDRRQVGAWVTGEYVPVASRREEIARAVEVAASLLWPDAEDVAA